MSVQSPVNKEYEFTIIARDMPEDQGSKLIAKYEEIALRDGGIIVKKDDWGTQRLSYPMKKQHRGHYVWYDLATKKENIAEMERNIKFDDNILKHLVIKIADKVDVEQRRIELAKVFVEEEQQGN
ncbi:MAG: 30S ribosomal protein S6 [Oligoflexales bacterium]|nr:30S ribosomal protein S6 [Oligoflexales bacterium]